MKYIAIFLFFIVLSYSCATQKNTNYIRDLNEFDTNYIEHFPDTEEPIIYTVAFPNIDVLTNNGAFFSAAFKYDPKSILIADLNSHRIIDDYSDLIIIDRSQKVINIKESDCSSFPIHSFVNEIYHLKLYDSLKIEKQEFETVLPPDFKIYVIDAKQGVFLNQNQLFKDDRMPDCWKHGISKGIAISEKRKIVLYWLELW